MDHAPLAAPTANRPEILAKVRACIAESLAIEESRVALESRLLGDLHADSLDFVEMLFSFERIFSIPLQHEALHRLMRSDYEDQDLGEDGSLRAEDLAVLELWLPALKTAEKRETVTPRELFGYLTVESLVLMIEKELASS